MARKSNFSLQKFENNPEDWGRFPKKRKHCPDCCYYLDGVKIGKDDGSPSFFNYAGMQHHRFSTGDIYERVGHTTPCHCKASDFVVAGYLRDHDDIIAEHPCQCKKPGDGMHVPGPYRGSRDVTLDDLTANIGRSMDY